MRVARPLTTPKNCPKCRAPWPDYRSCDECNDKPKRCATCGRCAKCGERKRSRPNGPWHVHFKDQRGEWHRLPAYTDKGASQAFGRHLEKLAAIRAAHASLDDDMSRWLEGLIPKHREKLAEWGMIDESARLLTDPLRDHVQDYHDHLTAKGDTEQHANQERSRVLAVFTGCGFVFWSDIKGGVVERWLSDQRDAEAMSTRTSNGHLGALKSFCRWMHDDGRAGSNPVQRVKAVPVTDEQQRGVFTVDQVRTLLETTAASKKVRCRMDGPTRALLYHLAVETGLRAGAIAGLTRDSFRFADNGSAIVSIEAGQQKNRRRHRVPLRSSLASEIRLLIARTPASRTLFNLRGRAAELLRNDLADAELPEYDADGHRLDFHSFRHTAGTWLSEHGVDLKVVQEVLGHRTFAMTADRYTHARLERVAAEMEKLPELRATGTDDAATCRLACSNDVATGRVVSHVDEHDRDSDNENAFTERRSGGIGRRGGLKIR